MYSRAMYVFLIVFLLFATQATWSVFGKYQETKENKRHAQKELAELKKRESEVKDRIEHLKTREGVEREIREKFGLAKEGEGVIVVVKSPKSEQESFAPRSSLWGSVFGNFFDIFN